MSRAARLDAPNQLAFAYGAPLATGVIRFEPEDFVVREYLGFEPSGEGQHLLLNVRKRGANSKWVARQLAARAGVRVREVGLSGLKDRHAVTEQAYTVPVVKSVPADWVGFSGEGFVVTAAERHRRKLPRGAHRGNAFEIIVRDFSTDREALRLRLDAIALHGVPNYFGEQRFGNDNRNLAVAERWLCDGDAPADRDERSFALSAARSALFNAVLSERVTDGTWNRLLHGEVINLDGTGSVFIANLPDAELTARCAQLDIHPTGPLCGIGESRVSADALAVEDRVLAPWARWRQGLSDINVVQSRRALRLAVQDLAWEYVNNLLTLRFRLTRGAFATAVLREIVAGNAVGEGYD